MMWDSGQGMGWWMLMGSVWFVVFWGIVIWAVVRLTSRPERDESALELAKRRYAAGQLSREEFDQIRRDIAA